MSHIFRRTLSLFTVAALALGGTVVGLSPAQAAAEVNVIPDRALRECIAIAMHNAGTGASPGHPGYTTEADSISKDDLQSLLNAWNARGWSDGLHCYDDRVASLDGLNVIAGLNHADMFRSFTSQGGTITDVTPLVGLTSLQSLNLKGTRIADISALARLSNLTNLDLSGNGIADISALARLSNLTNLDLSGNRIADVSPLAGLSRLENLVLYGNQITSISALAGLSNLTSLGLWGNGITDISPLAGLSRLNSLSLYGNQITDIAGLAGLTNLTYIELGNNRIANISPLAGLTGLWYLDLSDNEVTDASPLGGLSNLTNLDLRGNGITDVSPLAGLSRLENLVLYGNQITSISALAGLSNLTSLGLGGNGITDISPLAGLSRLNSLSLSDNQITDISVLAGLTNLTSLGLDNNKITNISPLTDLTLLRALSLSDNQIVDVSPLAGLTDLYTLTLANNKVADISSLVGSSASFSASSLSLDLSGNQITDITALAGFRKLGGLYLENNEIIDISPLAVQTDLQIVFLSSNQIADVSPLAGLSKLHTLRLGDNEITDISALAGLTLLRTLRLADNQIVDVSPLAGLTHLFRLTLANNKVADISSLAGLLNAPSSWGDGGPQLSEVTFNGNQITDLSSLARDADGQVRAGNSKDLASEYAGIWGGFMNQIAPTQTATAQTTVLLPTVRTASDSKYPIVWTVISGDAAVNRNGTITYNSVGPVQLEWSNPMPANRRVDDSCWDNCAEQTVTVSTFTGIVSVNVTAGSSQLGTPSASDSEADKDIVLATTTGGAARLADGQDSYTITAAVASKDGTPLTGFAANLTATAPADVSVGAWKDNGDGTYSALVTSTAPGNYEVRVALDGTTIGTIPVNFIAATVTQTVRLLNESQHAEGLGFLPGEEVQVTVHSDPIDLGRFTADGRGALAVDFTVPAKFALGRHTVEFVGATSGRVVVAFDVVAASGGAKSSAGASTGGVVFDSESAPMGIALAFTCLVAAAFAFAMTRIRPRWAMR